MSVSQSATRLAPVLLALATPIMAGDSLDVVINEIRIDQSGDDNDEYFELAGTPNTSLSGVWYLVIGDGPGGSGVVDGFVNLEGYWIPESGYFVAAESTFTLGTADATTTLNFENSDNVTHLLVTDFTGGFEDLDFDDDGVLDWTPWSQVLDHIALVEEPNPPASTEFYYGEATVGPDGTFVPGHVIRFPDGASSLTSWNVGDFGLTQDTPGAANVGPTIVYTDGGVQTLVVDGGPVNAGDLYLILASVTGTTPTIILPSGPLPLVFDQATLYSLENTNGPVFQNTFGVLDGDGKAYAALNLPALGPGSIGFTLFTAGIVFDSGTLGDVLVTNYTGVNITF